MAFLAVPGPFDFDLTTERFRAFGVDRASLWHEGGLHRVVGGREVRIEAAAGGVEVEPLDAETEPVVRAVLGLAFDLEPFYAWAADDEMLALLVDWGYRSDGIPVRLFDSWTCLPAGPAVLAAKTGATILPIVVRRRPDGRMYVGADAPIKVRSTDPIEIGRATQAVALALQRIVAAAPDQWYSFKPMWPPTREEADALAQRPEAEGARQYLAELDGSGAGHVGGREALAANRGAEPPVSRGEPASASGGA